jgi:hypothetical protein
MTRKRRQPRSAEFQEWGATYASVYGARYGLNPTAVREWLKKHYGDMQDGNTRYNLTCALKTCGQHNIVIAVLNDITLDDAICLDYYDPTKADNEPYLTALYNTVQARWANT